VTEGYIENWNKRILVAGLVGSPIQYREKTTTEWKPAMLTGANLRDDGEDVAILEKTFEGGSSRFHANFHDYEFQAIKLERKKKAVR
jgi:hypothetical protein